MPDIMPIIHGVVGAQFGDLEFDVGKSVRWSDFYVNDLFIMDINTGEQRYWIVNWAESFPGSEHLVTPLNWFREPAAFRQAQFEGAQLYFPYGDDDWCLFIDAHEGVSFDNRSLPDDYNAEPFMSWVYRECQRAVDNAQDRAYLPFYVYLKYDDLQNVTYGTAANSGAQELGIPTVQQAISVPFYKDYGWLCRLVKVSAMRNPAFDWTTLDQPVSTPPVGLGSWLVPTTGTATTPDDVSYTITTNTRFEARLTYDSDNTGILQTIASNRSNSGSNIGFHFRIVNGGLYLFLGNAAGTTVVSNTLGSLATALPGLVDGEGIYVRAEARLIAGTLTVTGYASRNGVSWTTLASPRTATTVTYPLFDGTDPIRIGRYGTDTSRYQGNIYWVQLTAIDQVAFQFPGSNVNSLTTPNLWLTGGTTQTVEVLVRVSADWQIAPLVDGFDGIVYLGNRFGLRRSASGNTMQFYCYGSDGTATTASATVPVGWANGQTVWLRATNNATTLTWEWAADSEAIPTVWTQLRTPLAATTPGLRAGASSLTIGAESTSRPHLGRIRRAIVRDTIGGANVVEIKESDVSSVVTSFICTTGQTVTVTGSILQILPNTVVWRFDVQDYPGTGTTITIGGKVWTVSGLPASIDYNQPVTNAKMQVLSYGYAHWNRLDVDPGQTTVAALSEANDDGYRMRSLISLTRPLAGLPFGTPYQGPGTDPAGLPGPWAVDVVANVDPALASTVEEDGHTPPDATMAGLRTPLYDTIMRLNLRDGLWYERGNSGNIPLAWDDVNQVWVPRYSPEEWERSGVGSSPEPEPEPSLMSLSLDGSSGTYTRTSDFATFNFADAGFTLATLLSTPDWSPATSPYIVDQWGSAGQRGWAWYLTTNGMTLDISHDGTAVVSFHVDWDDTTIGAPTDGDAVALGVTFNINLIEQEDEVRFYNTTDGIEWVPISDIITQPNLTGAGIFNSNAQVQVGAQGGTNGNLDALIRFVSIRTGVSPTAFGGTEIALMRGDKTLNPAFDRYGNTWSNQGAWTYEEMTNAPYALLP